MTADGPDKNRLANLGGCWTDVIPAELNVGGVTAFCTLRNGGVSHPPYDSWNLGDHVGDNGAAVAENRRRLAAKLGVPVNSWLNQVHGTRVLEAGSSIFGTEAPEGDALWTCDPGIPCVVMTADCLPVILAANDASVVSVAHAGWRGLAAGVLEATIAAMPGNADRLRVWLGPAIGAQAFEVGEDVRATFAAVLGAEAGGCFRPGLEPGKFLADLYTLARIRLERAGVETITGGRYCTLSEPDRFFSYRRDGATGRMATVVMINP